MLPETRPCDELSGTARASRLQHKQQTSTAFSISSGRRQIGLALALLLKAVDKSPQLRWTKSVAAARRVFDSSLSIPWCHSTSPHRLVCNHNNRIHSNANSIREECVYASSAANTCEAVRPPRDDDAIMTGNTPAGTADAAAGKGRGCADNSTRSAISKGCCSATWTSTESGVGGGVGKTDGSRAAVD